ncbi:hypothetical protein BGY98DRAFT_931218 [Russula aff. rugulosa BPL654]|nr:hypothetical protein BGY98DRAFT_931218 [Russula aff. rugulosa BPL654]
MSGSDARRKDKARRAAPDRADHAAGTTLAPGYGATASALELQPTPPLPLPLPPSLQPQPQLAPSVPLPPSAQLPPPALPIHTTVTTAIWFVFFRHNTPDLAFFCEKLYPHETIIELKKKIKEDLQGDYEEYIANARPKDMEVWKFRDLKVDSRSRQMNELLSNLKFTDNEVELFQRQEPLLVRVVQKAKRSREDDYLEDARQCKLAHLEPNKANSASIYQGLQEVEEDRILDNCPHQDKDIPPLPMDLETEVDKLVDAMCLLGYEKDKQANTQDLLHRIFGGPQRRFNYSVDNGSHASMHGHVLASHGGPSLIIEFKRQIMNAEPQVSNHFLHLSVQSVQDVFYGWRLPALGIILRGPLISFVGLVMIDHQVRALPLTHPFVTNDSEIGDRTCLYAAFEAARRLLVASNKMQHVLSHRPHHTFPDIIDGSQTFVVWSRWLVRCCDGVFPEADRILDSKSLCIAGEKWLEDIDDIVRKFHAEGYVHGDLRPPNFIVNSGRVFLIDFDWGGKEGQATFPRKKLHPILQDGRWNTKISKNDDERVKEYTKCLISDTIKEKRAR